MDDGIDEPLDDDTVDLKPTSVIGIPTVLSKLLFNSSKECGNESPVVVVVVIIAVWFERIECC